MKSLNPDGISLLIINDILVQFDSRFLLGTLRVDITLLITISLIHLLLVLLVHFTPAFIRAIETEAHANLTDDVKKCNEAKADKDVGHNDKSVNFCGNLRI